MSSTRIGQNAMTIKVTTAAQAIDNQLDCDDHNDFESTNQVSATIVDVCHTRRFAWSVK